MDKKVIPHVDVTKAIECQRIAYMVGSERLFFIMGDNLEIINSDNTRISMDIQPKQLATSYFHIGIVTKSGDLFMFGKGRKGQLGLGDVKELLSTPMQVPLENFNNESVNMVACGYYHTVVLTEKGSVYTFGTGIRGQLGHGNTTEYLSTPKLVPVEAFKAAPHPLTCEEGSRIVMVAAGCKHTVALNLRGDVFTWGCGWNGQLGHGDINDQWSPRQVLKWHGDPLRTWTPTIKCVAAGESHTVACSVFGDVYTWGNNQFGQLGRSDTQGTVARERTQSYTCEPEWIIYSYHIPKVQQDSMFDKYNVTTTDLKPICLNGISVACGQFSTFVLANDKEIATNLYVAGIEYNHTYKERVMYAASLPTLSKLKAIGNEDKLAVNENTIFLPIKFEEERKDKLTGICADCGIWAAFTENENCLMSKKNLFFHDRNLTEDTMINILSVPEVTKLISKQPKPQNVFFYDRDWKRNNIFYNNNNYNLLDCFPAIPEPAPILRKKISRTQQLLTSEMSPHPPRDREEKNKKMKTVKNLTTLSACSSCLLKLSNMKLK